MNISSLREDLDLYKKRCPQGSFITSLLENNLIQAVANADESSSRNLAELVRFTFNHLPGFMWGSPQRVKAWLAGEVDENGDVIPKEG